MQVNSYKNIWKIAYPIITGSVAQNIINVVDTAFLGRLGPEAMGAAGNAIIFYFIFMVIGMGFSIGSEILVGRRNGEGRYKEVGLVIDHSFYILLPLSLLLFLFQYFYAGVILGQFTKSEVIFGYSMEYLNVRKYGIFFAFANLSFRTFFVGVTRTAVLIWSTMFMAGINVIFDYFLIFGKFGFPEMGVAGAALASVIAESTTTIFFIIYTLRKVNLEKYGLLKFSNFRFSIANTMTKVSTPIMVQHFLAISSWMIFFLIIEKMGSRELAISHIVRSIYMVLMIPLFGFSATTNTLVSNIIGMNRHDEVLVLTRKVVHLSLMATAVFLPVILFLPESFVSLYTNDASLILETIPVLRIICFAMFFFSVAYTLFSAVSGTGNTLISMLIETLTLAVYLAAAYFIAIDLNSSLQFVWCSEFAYFGMMGLLSFLYLKFGNWRLKVI